MKIYDISQPVFQCAVYPGDPAPQREILSSTNCGDLYNLTAFSMCAHNGTHLDAPYHFIADGKTVDAIPLEKTVGKAFVAPCHGILNSVDATEILNKTDASRILLKGNGVVSEEAAAVFARAKIDLLGTESQSVGPQESPMEVHRILLGADVVLLEGLRLDNVPVGTYLLYAAPLLLDGADGAPCRAILTEI